MRLLLTGSNGFLGTRIVADAHARGWEVVGVGRAASPGSPVDTYVRHDLTRPVPADAVPGTVDAVVHCAALASPWAPPQEFVAANVDATRHVARWAADHGAPPLVLVSSSSVLYRDEDQLGLTEDSPVPPDHEQINVYSRTKRISERVVAQYPGAWSVLRPRAVFGVGDTVLLPRILRLAERGALPVLEPRDGPRVRVDLTDVHTAAHYVTEAVERGVTGTYHLTNAEPVDLYPFLLDVLQRLGAHPRTVHVPAAAVRAAARAGEVASATLLGWREPPLTRFGVSVLSRSKTFDVSRTLRDLGAPAVSLDESVDRLVRAHG
ncbi:NAD-dependent epimerase/dehydratase family protein [Cellulomonas fimi]|uniref:NAD-dependent epimerase/dehydratase n=1 Tax=Cellulomonas fimi (strain ATCC 484 / DSM 20113 / JCM 1341 / CCUG 24087 / LMG 16345 / NBRC 15513 / NCIMB 8980 / NCTC 7547 / NRS-133) TaxID=590998 RepID=F4H0F4_CELFA|nr:NAD(P)-dependent oxidoreductase [Cellulomonas fimi]AEE47323.1 NAD-dependent epimerase/dehydratase [Cellulomonas fimi ATCC 484]NNH05848.1 NAD(P)-dependent oxidoreductase [Cellulomonas fimi]VEH35921.1 Cholesterol dehydrogenase [Cellulomonas fimi]